MIQGCCTVWWCSCCITVTRQVPLEGQELLPIPEHLCSPQGFSGLRVAQSLVFCIVFCRSLFVLFFFWQSFHHVVCYTYFKISFFNQTFRVHIHKNRIEHFIDMPKIWGRPYNPIILKTIWVTMAVNYIEAEEATAFSRCLLQFSVKKNS